MKTNKFVVYFFIISIILNTLLFGNESISKEPNPFVNHPNYLEILKIKPNIILDEAGKPNLLHTSNKLKENLLSLKTIKLKGYYGIFFNNKEILFFTKFSKEGNIYNSFFITEQILFDAKLLEKNRNYFEVNINVKYRHDKFGDLEYVMFAFNGIIPLIDDSIILQHFDKHIYFIIYKLP